MTGRWSKRVARVTISSQSAGTSTLPATRSAVTSPHPSTTRNASSWPARRLHTVARSVGWPSGPIAWPRPRSSSASPIVGAVARRNAAQASRRAVTSSVSRPTARRRSAVTCRPRRRSVVRTPNRVARATSAPTAENTRNIGLRITAATTTPPIRDANAPATPTPLARRCARSASGTSIGAGTHTDCCRGVRCSVARHGSLGRALSAALSCAAAASSGPTRRRDAPSVTATSGRRDPPSRSCVSQGVRPVSCVKWAPSVSTSSTPWCSSTASSSSRTAAPVARPMT